MMLVQIVDGQPVEATAKVYGDEKRIGIKTAMRLAKEGKMKELAEYGLAIAENQPVPEGKHATDWTLETVKGKPVRKPVLEDIPAPRELSDAEKLEAATGLTVSQIKAVLEAK